MHRITYPWDFLGQIHVLGDGHLPFQRTFLVDVLHLITQIRFLIYQANHTIFDLQMDFSTLLDLLGEVALGFYGELLATVMLLAASF